MTGIVILLIFWCLMGFLYHDRIKEAAAEPFAVQTVDGTVNWRVEGGEKAHRLTDGQTVFETIRMIDDQLTGISIKFGFTDLTTAQAHIELREHINTQTVVAEWDREFNASYKNGFVDFLLKEAVPVKADAQYDICITVSDIDQGAVVLGTVTAKEPVSWTRMTDGDDMKDYGLSFRLLNGDCHALIVFYWLLVTLGTALVIATTFLVAVKASAHVSFVVVGLLVGLLYMLVIPPYGTPDENAHFVTTYANSSRILGKKAVDSETNCALTHDSGYIYFSREEYLTQNAYVRFTKGLFGKMNIDHTEQLATRKPLSRGIGSYVSYAPQIAGVTLARMVHLSDEQMMFSGQLFALIGYLIVMFFAIKWLPKWKEMMILIGVLPVTIQQVASYSYDSILIAACFLVFARIMKIKYGRDKARVRDAVILLLCAAVIALVKFVYLPIYLLMFMIPIEKIPVIEKYRKWLPAMISLIVIASFLIVLPKVVQSLNSVSIMEKYNGNDYYSMKELLIHPLTTIAIILRSIIELGDVWFTGIFTLLGWLNIPTPGVITFAFFVLVYLSMQQERHEIVSRDRVICVIVSLLVFLLAAAALLMSWTPAGSPIMKGFQGRYLIPVLAVIMLVFSSKRVYVSFRNKMIPVLLAVGVHLLMIRVVIAYVLTRFIE